MNIFKTNTEDNLYWLKVAMRQAQADIKSLKSEVELLKIDNKALRSNYEPKHTVDVKIK